MKGEVVLAPRSESFWVSQASIESRLEQVVCDWNFGNDKPGAERELTVPHGKYLLRRVWKESGSEVIPLCQTQPLRGDLELRHFSRKHFVCQFDLSKSSCLSVPYISFIDGFGLYRNSYRSLMGFYITFAAFTARERTRRANVLPVTLGPHGSNFEDVVRALVHLAELDEGLILEIKGQRTFVCAFPLFYTGDMPQQQWNAGMKTQRAKLGCRMCYISDAERGNLDYYLVRNGRYHFQTMSLRKKMNTKGITAKRTFATQWGLNDEEDEPALMSISPALDIIETRPSDPAHSEYAGLTKQLHTLLIETILLPAAAKKYSAVLRKFPFPSGYGRLQSPLHHLKSWSLSDHARWSVVVLRLWLRPSHVHPLFLEALEKHLHLGTAVVVDTIVQCFGAVAKSNGLLMSDRISTEDRLLLMTSVKDSRNRFQYQSTFCSAVPPPVSRTFQVAATLRRELKCASFGGNCG